MADFDTRLTELQKHAFTQMVNEKGRDELVRLACTENGEKLFAAFAGTLAKAEMKPKKPAENVPVQPKTGQVQQKSGPKMNV